MRRLRELPPTAGLPLRAADLLPRRADLARAAGRFLGAAPPVVASSGTAALLVALAALRQGAARRRVVFPAYTCPLVPLAILAAGLDPVACDTLPGSPDLDPRALAALLDAEVLAILPTHLGGRLADVEAARRAAGKVGATVIEDAAQAFGARRDGVPAGLLGDVGFHSLAVGKGLTTYEGGLLHARDPALRAALARAAARMLRADHATEALRVVQLAATALLYRPAGLVVAYGAPLRRALRAGDPAGAVGDRFGPRLPVHAVGAWRQGVGTAALRRLPGHLRSTRETAARLRARLDGAGGFRTIGDRPGEEGTWPVLMLVAPTRATRDAALARLWTRGLGVSRMFVHAVPDHPDLRGRVGDAPAPNARDLADRLLTVGTSGWVTERDAAEIAEGLERAASEGAPDEEEAARQLVA